MGEMHSCVGFIRTVTGWGPILCGSVAYMQAVEGMVMHCMYAYVILLYAW
jgi:hypothetical protein